MDTLTPAERLCKRWEKDFEEYLIKASKAPVPKKRFFPKSKLEENLERFDSIVFTGITTDNHFKGLWWNYTDCFDKARTMVSLGFRTTDDYFELRDVYKGIKYYNIKDEMFKDFVERSLKGKQHEE